MMNSNGTMLYRGGRQPSRLRIPKCVLCETNDNYQDMYGRSYDLKVTSRELNDLQNVFASSKMRQGASLSEVMLAKQAPSVLSLGNTPGRHIIIPNGWNNKRFRFVMLVVEYLESCRFEHYIQGYTDYSDMSYAGSVDPRMRMYINSITTVKITEDIANMGSESFNILGTYNVITDVMGVNSSIENPLFKDSLIRPMDLFDTVSIRNSQYVGGMSGYGNQYDASTTLKEGSVSTSRKANNNPITHIASCINAGVKGVNMTSGSNDPSQALSEASSLLSESIYSENGFIGEIFKLTGSLTPTSFEFGLIDTIDPSCKVDIFKESNRRMENLTPTFAFSNGMSGESDFSGITIETSIALTAVHAINAVLVENFISTAAFSILVRGGHVDVIPPAIPQFYMPTIVGDMQTYFTRAAVTKIAELIVPMLTQNFAYDLDMHFVSDNVGDTVVELSVHGNPKQIFRVPTFADSLFNPVITPLAARGTFVDSFDNLIGCVKDVVMENYTYTGGRF